MVWSLEVWDREKIVIIPDHYIFTSDERANRNVDILRDFCMEQNIKYFYDIKDLGNFMANPDYKGVCHIALAQEGHSRPGEVSSFIKYIAKSINNSCHFCALKFQCC
ncbi:hypothetical protein I3843_13G089000 [Carya illinoinensis]|nr:hypothetical protein I3843_13G089000 [Carya illinoinensis]